MLLAVASVVVFLLHGFEGAMSRDVAVYAYAGQQVAEGVPPYENILNRAGPLAHLVPGAGAFVGRSLGVDDLLAMRVTLMLVSVLAVWACYVLGRDLFRSRGAGAIAAVTLLSFQGFVTYATYGPREKTTMVLLVILALAATTHRRWAVAGAATALATLTWQGAFIPLTAGCLLAMVLLRGRRPRVAALLRWAGTGTAVAAAAIGYFALVGALPEFWEGFYAVNAGWTTQQGLLAQLADPQPLVAGYGWSLALLALGPVGCLAVVVARLRKLDRDDPAHGGMLALAAGVVVALLWALTSFQGWPDAFVMLPYAACGVAGLVHLVLNRMPRPVVATATAVLVTAALVVAGIDATLSRSSGLVDDRRHVAAVAGVLGPDIEMLAIGNPTPLVLRHESNPIRYQLFGGGLGTYLEDTYPGGLGRLADEIGETRPTVITVRRLRFYAWLKPLLVLDYKRLGGPPGRFTWFVSTDTTTREQRQEMRHAIRDTLPGGTSSDVERSLT